MPEIEQQELDFKKVPILKRVKFRLKIENHEIIPMLWTNMTISIILAYLGTYLGDPWSLASKGIIAGLWIGSTITYAKWNKKRNKT